VSDTIVVIDADAATERTVPRAEIDRTLAFVKVAGADVPVSRIESRTEKGRRVVRLFAADGRCLSTRIGG
jgi:hypothetical protein